MAAPQHAGGGHLVELRDVGVEQMEDLLREEAQEWREQLYWDFRPSADLVRRFVRMQGLSGFAWMEAGRVEGYLYYVMEEDKGVIGDLYVHPRARHAQAEFKLLAASLDSMRRNPYLRRVESQLMLIDSPLTRELPYRPFVNVYPREFMTAVLDPASQWPEGRGAGTVHVGSWEGQRQDEAAAVIREAYRGHIDARINDQYQSHAGARKFLSNIIQYPGCGSFFKPASFMASDPQTGALCGISLASLVAADAGHITQICFAPAWQGRGAGYELLRHSLDALRSYGCTSVSLTVTAANRGAVELYRRCGFRSRRRFAAFVWEGF